jgi:hypothetical protein
MCVFDSEIAEVDVFSERRKLVASDQAISNQEHWQLRTTCAAHSCSSQYLVRWTDQFENSLESIRTSREETCALIQS